MRDRNLGVPLSLLACAMGFVAATNTGCGRQETAVVNAADTYLRACARCHGTNGKGIVSDADTPRPRDFTDASWQASMSDEAIATVIRDGKGSMPSFGDVLSEREIAAAVATVRMFRP